jgi:hypothetical protein
VKAENKQTNKQTKKQKNKQTNKQTNLAVTFRVSVQVLRVISLTEIFLVVEVSDVLDLVGRQIEVLHLHERHHGAEAELQLDVRQLGLDHTLLRELVDRLPGTALLGVRMTKK